MGEGTATETKPEEPGIIGKLGSTAKKHPWATAAIIIGAGVGAWFLGKTIKDRLTVPKEKQD